MRVWVRMLTLVVMVTTTGQLEESAEWFRRYTRLKNDPQARVTAVDSCTLYR